MEIKQKADKEDTRYLPSSMEGHLLRSGLMVSEGVAVEPKVTKVTQSEDTENASCEVTLKGKDEVVKDDVMSVMDEKEIINNEGKFGIEENSEVERNKEDILDLGSEEASVEVEEEGGSWEGSADEEQLVMEGIEQSVPRKELAKATEEDRSLRVVGSSSRRETWI